FKTCFPNASVHYAMKADAEEGVLTTLYEAGAGFEAASLYELQLLVKHGIPPDRIIYGTSVKPRSHIRKFVEYGVDRFAFDSHSELDKIAALSPHARVYVRMNVNDAGSVYRFSEKFGTARENVVPLLVRAKEIGLIPYGISFHVGSQASNPLAWAEAIESLVPILGHLDEIGIRIQVLNIGGGYPCVYASSEQELKLEEIAQSIKKACEKLPYQPDLIVEPGRAMVAEAAVLIASVIARIERIEHTWLFLDAGVYNGLFESLAYQGSIRYHVTSLRPSYNAGEAVFALAGPTGDSWDVISREAHLPQDIEPGDKLVFHTVGAYNLVMVGRFNGFSKPPVHFV
ncbi:MAG: type III PLP-dependent enzyme, partial [Patescibacteria group bacterium]|nr:type III PLP-dependent enzyme [Patescibacteria group bacterium]